MAVNIRLTRGGRKNRAFYRIGAYDSRTRRDGAAIENLGYYDPLVTEGNGVVLKEERIKYWISVGATPSETIASFLREANIEYKRGPARKARNRKREEKAKAKGGRRSQKAKAEKAKSAKK